MKNPSLSLLAILFFLSGLCACTSADNKKPPIGMGQENSMTTNADETMSNEPDGSSIQRKADGTKIIKRADGLIITLYPDGSKSFIEPDGSVVQKKKDDSMIITQPDGTIMEIDADGKMIRGHE